MNDLVRANLKEIVKLQDIISTNELHYKSKRINFYNFDNILAYFLRDIHEGHLSLEDADEEQSSFAAKLKNLDVKNSFLK